MIISGALVTAPEFAKPMLQSARTLVCTEHELEQLMQHLGVSNRANLFDFAVDTVIVTRGSIGSLIIAEHAEYSVAAASAQKVVDPVGAGDGFVGGLAAGFAFGYETKKAVQLGAVVASYIVEAVGCQTNLPSFDEADKRLIESYKSS